MSPEIGKLLRDVDRVPGTPANAVSLIREAIESSPYLQQRMEREIAQGNLKAIAVRDGHDQWGHFDDPDRTVAVDVDLFKQFARQPETLKDAITYVLGHEVGHGNNLADRNRANRVLNTEMRNAYWTENPDGFADITGAVDRYVKFAGTDETRAEIEGWNALVSRVETQQGGQLDMDKLLERAYPVSSFVEQVGPDKFKAIDGVSLAAGPYLTYLDPTKAKEISAGAKAISGVYYTPEVQARYASHAVEVASTTAEHFQEKTNQTPYETRLNFSAIDQTPKSLETSGLDLGGEGSTFQLTDTSRGMNWISLKHTRSKEDPVTPAEELEKAPTF